nr:transposase [Phyllobacterium trifolii]
MAEWRIVETLLPAERGRKSRPALDNRRFLNGILHVLRIGCPWRDMHERYGKWNSVLCPLPALGRARRLGSIARDPLSNLGRPTTGSI